MLVFEQHIIEYGIIQDLKIYSTSPDPKPKSARDGIFRAKPAGDNARAGTFMTDLTGRAILSPVARCNGPVTH